jgi:hypothetical protein
MLAVAFAMETDGDLRDQFKATYGEDALTQLDLQLKEVKSKSEAMGGFLQSTHQLMRDSIKPKNSETFLRDLNEKVESLQVASSDEERNEIIDGIVKDFGPGSGLKGIVQLDRLVGNLTELNKTYVDETDQEAQGKLLYKKFGIDSKLEEELAARLGFEKEAHSGRLFKNSDNPEVSRLTNQYSQTAIIAGYKTKQDFLNLTAGFAFTTALANDSSEVVEGKSQAKSSGRALVDLIKTALEAPNSDLKSSYGQYIQAADDFYNKNLNKSQFNLEEQEYIDSVKTLYDLNLDENGKSQGIEYSKLSSAEKYLHAMTFVRTRSQMDPYAGRFGEGLLNIAKYEQVRSRVYGGESLVAGDDWHWTESGVMLANTQAFESGKIDSKSIAGMFGSMQESYRRYTGSANATSEDVLSAILSMGSLSETPTQKEAANTMRDFLYRKKGAADQILTTVRNTAVGQFASTLSALVDPSQFEVKSSLTEALIEKGLTKEAADRASLILQKNSAESMLLDSDSELETHLRSSLESMNGKVTKPILTKSGSMVARAVLNNTGDHALNIAGIPLLGLIGSAIASGNVSSDAVQQFVGNSISALAYTRPGMLVQNSKPLTALSNMGASMGFKARMALEEDEGDTGKALFLMAVKEASMAATTAALTESVSNTITKSLGRQQFTLEADRYEGIRGVVGNAVGAMATTLLGMFIGETASKAILAPQASVIESVITAAQNTALEMQQAMGVAEEVDSDDFEMVDSQEGLVEYITYQSFSGDASQSALFSEDLKEEPSQLLDGQNNSQEYSYSLD